ncbi:unnamed protein product [Peniophora sp. CBMAI 1063]|nr:unnamed protein product [Peniophora sp. CBMAI 1063]
MTRQLLSSIRTLTFYANEPTASRRGKAIPQLTCRGAACKLYQPEVVRCKNAGGEGTDVDWTCEADLPEALRFGRVEVGCEGWSGPGDPYVYKESCGLEYRLVHVPDTLRNDQRDPFSSLPRKSVGDYAFFALFAGILIWILYNLFRSCWGSRPRPGGGRAPGPGTGRSPGFGGAGYGPRDDTDPPPPYVPDDKPGPSASTTGGIRGAELLGGAVLGGLGTYLATRNRGDREGERQRYDWERRREGGARERGVFGYGGGPVAYGGRRFDDDRGEGPSSGLGSMRRSTGMGGSNVR